MFEGGAERLSAAQRPNRLPRESTADIILTTEAPGTAADRRFSKPRPTVGRSYRFSFGDGMHSLLRHLLIVAGGSHHSRARDRQLSPPSSPVDHLPSLLGGGSTVLGVETGHRARRSRRRWSPPGSLQRQPQHTTPGSLVPPRPGQAQTKASVPMVADPGGPGRPVHGRMVLGGDRCRQPSCRGSPPAPWCPE
jgi:hypothetical protein